MEGGWEFETKAEEGHGGGGNRRGHPCTPWVIKKRVWEVGLWVSRAN
jgi:hypothetical protein